MVTVSRVLVVIALVLFVLAAFHVAAPIDLMAAGLAIFMASILTP